MNDESGLKGELEWLRGEEWGPRDDSPDVVGRQEQRPAKPGRESPDI